MKNSRFVALRYAALLFDAEGGQFAEIHDTPLKRMDKVIKELLEEVIEELGQEDRERILAGKVVIRIETEFATNQFSFPKLD